MKSKMLIFTGLSLAFLKSYGDEPKPIEYHTSGPISEIRQSVKIMISEQFSEAQDLNLYEGDYVDPKLELMLKLSGVNIDADSKIQIYKEDNSFDLSCFNCIIRSINFESFGQQPDNKAGL